MSNVLLVLLLTGCVRTDGITSGEEELWQHFPFDGNRTWEYISTDLEISYKLEGTMRADDPDPEVSEDFNIYHIDFVTRCVAQDPDCVDGGAVRTLGISSDISNGTLLHRFIQETVDITYDPPLVLAPEKMAVGESFETTTDGQVFTTTLIGFEPCEGIVNMQGQDFELLNCAAHLLIQDSDTNPITNYGLTGDYWVAKGLGIAGISLEGDDDHVWGLSQLDCEPIEECNGEW